MEQQFLQLVLQNVRHFISLSGQPAWQLAALGKHSTVLASLQIRIQLCFSMQI
jgi:hypothetical protein